ncbi:MAG TPA: DHH family phosphoesterase [Candidatus Nanoarchaeia archaeon]|nr:DHH family phosphoesterase [Candidatus Nanoarchaeia archaeon]
MISEEDLEELRGRLQGLQNPVFLFDNDCDGLCSYLLLRRWLGRGKGIAIRSYPDLGAQYVQKVAGFKADGVVVLDKPVLSETFLSGIAEIGIPLLVIDHHAQSISEDHRLSLYNPLLGTKKSDEPVTYWCYQLTGKKDGWIALLGCISDHYLPPFAAEVGARHPELWGKVKDVGEAYFSTGFGEIARALNFGLKDSLSHVVEMQDYLLDCGSPSDVLAEVSDNRVFRDRVGALRKKYVSLLDKSGDCWFGNLLFFDYGGDTSMSSDLANELSFRHLGKVVAVAYVKEGVSNLSLRGKGVRVILEKLLPLFPGASGGGHDDAVGARFKSSDLARFREALAEVVG